MTTYKEAASTGFNLLAQQYVTPKIFDGNFWFGGNTLHTCLTYLIAAKETDTKLILKSAYGIYQGMSSGTDWWRDDYGWWGNAFILAINHRNELGYQGAGNDQLFNSLSGAAQYCWGKLKSNWCAESYGSCDGDPDNSAGSADIIGGTFNTHNEPPMSGRNSVTNEGFWILSQQLAQLFPQNPSFSAAASAESAWFQDWLAYPSNHRGKTGILNADGIVLERPTGNGTDPAWYWSGDQGLFIEGLSFTGSANDIAVSAVNKMTDKDMVLHENMSFNDYSNLKQYIADYATGKGIFMRSVAALNLVLPDRPFTKFIENNATAVWCNRMPGNQFTFNWNPQVAGNEPKILQAVGSKTQTLCNLIMQTAGLEALNAALLSSLDEEIACTSGG